MAFRDIELNRKRGPLQLGKYCRSSRLPMVLAQIKHPQCHLPSSLPGDEALMVPHPTSFGQRDT